MWLINTTTIELELVPSHGADEDRDQELGSARPRYAILSHRWREDEVTFQDMKNHEHRKRKKGWRKLINCCYQAKLNGLGHAWIDTCCINKDSDAELTEAINSMFNWYKEAEVCYLYIDDLGAASTKTFKDAEIWQRGWCLQELIAPRCVICFNYEWSIIGDRNQLKVKIAAAAGIDAQLLAGTRTLSSYSIAQRMSWAARRKTTRPEDSAYCLLGIFDVNMPLIYGEGAEKAFLRLQSEIIKGTDDHSIFAWTGTSFPRDCGLLARSMLRFASCGNIQSMSIRRGRKPFSITNRGVSITLRMRPCAADTYLALLNCVDVQRQGSASETPGHMGIFLRRMYEDDSYIRVACGTTDIMRNADQLLCEPERDGQAIMHQTSIQVMDRHVNVIQSHLQQDQIQHYNPKLFGFKLETHLLEACRAIDGRHIMARGPGCTLSPLDSLLTIEDGCLFNGFFAELDISGRHDTIVHMSLHMDDDFNPVCFLAEEAAYYARYAANSGSATLNLTVEEELAQWKSFSQRSVTDELGWNEVRHGEDGQVLIRPNTLRPGLWQIRGDREDGIDAFLDFDIIRTGRYIHLTIKRTTTERGFFVWYVQMSEKLMIDPSRANTDMFNGKSSPAQSVCPTVG